MTERPILFKGEMVRAIRSGQKTQTRRIWKMPPGMGWYVSGALKGEETGDICDLKGPGWCSVDEVCSPYGRPGDRLWVRETWQGPLLDSVESDADLDWRYNLAKYQDPAHCVYAADGSGAPEFIDEDDNLRCRWRPSIHMPRWASRITLEITGVRVERLQEISYEDAIAEGIIDPATVPEFPASLNPSETVVEYCRRKKWPQRQYRELWESINGPGSWDLNPWVWVVEFKRIDPKE